MHPSTCLGKHRNSRGNKSYCFPRDKYIDYTMTLEDNQVVLWLKAMRELHMKDYFSFFPCFLTACLVFQDSDRGIQLTLLVCSQPLALQLARDYAGRIWALGLLLQTSPWSYRTFSLGPWSPNTALALGKRKTCKRKCCITILYHGIKYTVTNRISAVCDWKAGCYIACEQAPSEGWEKNSATKARATDSSLAEFFSLFRPRGEPVCRLGVLPSSIQWLPCIFTVWSICKYKTIHVFIDCEWSLFRLARRAKCERQLR